MIAEASLADRLARCRAATARVRAALAQVIVGQENLVEEVLWGLVAGGHVLLEGAPGLGKTLLVRALAASLDLRFSRIQFTPDLMPSDITGNNVLLLDAAGRSTGRFELHRGPVFAQLVLADEINRATPKTQSALLEAMQEHAVTIAGTRHVLEEPFMVLATENPIEMEGTYPLPEAQLDRFLLKVVVEAPSEELLTEVILRTTGHDIALPAPVLRREEALELRALCRDVAVSEAVARYVARLVSASVPGSASAPELVKSAVRYGAGVRGGQAVVLAAKAAALLDGRAHVAFEDIAKVALPALRHRIILSFEGEADGVSPDAVVRALFDSVAKLPASVARAAEEA